MYLLICVFSCFTGFKADEISPLNSELDSPSNDSDSDSDSTSPDSSDPDSSGFIETGGSSNYPPSGDCYASNPVGPDLLPSQAQTHVAETTTIDGYTDDYLYDGSNYIKVGVRRDWGASLVFYGLTNNSGSGTNTSNTIDANDTGREVQVAFYDPDRLMQGCAHDASCASGTPCPASISYLGWNPVQGGNRCNNGSGVSSYTFLNDRITHTVDPLFWNPNWDFLDCTNTACNDPSLSSRPADVQVVQTLRFVRQHILELKYTVIETGGLSHAITIQEMPTVYTGNGNNGPDLWRLMDASGNQILIDQPANDGFFVKNFSSSEPWVTLQNETLDYGVGLFHENGIRDFQGWQNRALPFNNFRAIFPFSIPAHSEVHARSYLLLGSFETIQNDAHWLEMNLAPFGDTDLPHDGQSIIGDSLLVQGWALDNKGLVSVTARIDEAIEVALNFDLPNPDVSAMWPSYPMGGNAGFQAEIPVESLHHDPNCGHQLEVVAKDDDGNERIIARKQFYLLP